MLTVHEHTKQINDIQMYKDQTMFVTASKDHTAKVGVESMPGQNGTQLCELFLGKKKADLQVSSLERFRNSVCKM